jgi:hypothetical protein
MIPFPSGIFLSLPVLAGCRMSHYFPSCGSIHLNVSNSDNLWPVITFYNHHHRYLVDSLVYSD